VRDCKKQKQNKNNVGFSRLKFQKLGRVRGNLKKTVGFPFTFPIHIPLLTLRFDAPFSYSRLLSSFPNNCFLPDPFPMFRNHHSNNGKKGRNNSDHDKDQRPHETPAGHSSSSSSANRGSSQSPAQSPGYQSPRGSGADHRSSSRKSPSRPAQPSQPSQSPQPPSSAQSPGHSLFVVAGAGHPPASDSGASAPELPRIDESGSRVIITQDWQVAAVPERLVRCFGKQQGHSPNLCC